jgi:peptide chain release factor subunit 3
MGVLFVGGKVEYGRVKKGQKLLVMPIKKRAIVTGILAEEEEIEKARSGDNIKLKLSGVDEKDINDGFVICSPKRPVHAASSFEAQLVIMELKGIMCPGFSAVMHMHTVTEEVTIGVRVAAILL